MDNKHVLQGKLYDSQTNQGIAGAKVKQNNAEASTTTNELGEFMLTTDTNGKRSVNITAPGYKTANIMYYHNGKVHDFELEPLKPQTQVNPSNPQVKQQVKQAVPIIQNTKKKTDWANIAFWIVIVVVIGTTIYIFYKLLKKTTNNGGLPHGLPIDNGGITDVKASVNAPEIPVIQASATPVNIGATIKTPQIIEI